MLTVNKEGASSNQWGSHTGNDARVVGVTHDLSMPQMSCPDVSLPPFALSLSLSLSLNSRWLFFLLRPTLYSQVS